jgi:ferrochelatase
MPSPVDTNAEPARAALDAPFGTTVLLVNMGGPSSVNEVEPYLRAIFADPAILDLPALLRRPLGWWIARRRAPKVAARYQLIGGASPLPEWTRKQVGRVASSLAELGSSLRVAHAFRYCSPTIGEALATAAHEGSKRIVLLPLFPHYVDAMSGSIERAAKQRASALGLELRVVGAFGERPEIVALWRRLLARSIEDAGSDASVLFVAHGIPERNVQRGEDYPERVASTARTLGRELGPEHPWALAFQSRLGPLRWTGPYLEQEVARLARERRPLVLAPLSFVADCLETRYDLDRVAAEQAKNAGIPRVVRMPAFNDDPDFGAALARLAIERNEEVLDA